MAYLTTLRARHDRLRSLTAHESILLILGVKHWDIPTHQNDHQYLITMQTRFAPGSDASPQSVP